MDVPRHNLAQSKIFRWAVCPLALALSLFWLLLTARLVSLVLLCIVVVVVLWLTLSRHLHPRRLIIAWALFVASTFLPVDISVRDTPGPPHFVRLEYGKPDTEMADEEAMGQVLLGGCLTTGLEPRWLFVWRSSHDPIPYDDISEHRLRRLGLALVQYTQDNDETLPPLRNLDTVKQALLPYTHNSDPAMFVQPQTGEPYQPNAALSGLSFGQIPAQDKAPIFYEAHPAPDGTCRFLTLDGKVRFVSASQWPRWKKAARLP